MVTDSSHKINNRFGNAVLEVRALNEHVNMVAESFYQIQDLLGNIIIEGLVLSYIYIYISVIYMRVIMSALSRGVERVTTVGEGRRAFKILRDKPPGTRPLGGHRHTQDDSIRMNV